MDSVIRIPADECSALGRHLDDVRGSNIFHRSHGLGRVLVPCIVQQPVLALLGNRMAIGGFTRPHPTYDVR